MSYYAEYYRIVRGVIISGDKEKSQPFEADDVFRALEKAQALIERINKKERDTNSDTRFGLSDVYEKNPVDLIDLNWEITWVDDKTHEELKKPWRVKSQKSRGSGGGG